MCWLSKPATTLRKTEKHAEVNQSKVTLDVQIGFQGYSLCINDSFGVMAVGGCFGLVVGYCFPVDTDYQAPEAYRNRPARWTLFHQSVTIGSTSADELSVDVAEPERQQSKMTLKLPFGMDQQEKQRGEGNAVMLSHPPHTVRHRSRQDSWTVGHGNGFLRRITRDWCVPSVFQFDRTYVDALQSERQRIGRVITTALDLASCYL